MKKVRLQKMLSDYGISSRRRAEDLIKEGKVSVNGRIAKLGDKVEPNKDKVIVNGKKVIKQSHKYYIMLHKPRGFVSTMEDELSRKCVAGLVSDVPARVYPIGRLDKDSEGLILMTNDGEFANSIMHPSKHIEKKYRVTVKPRITENQLVEMSAGMEIDGYMTQPTTINVLKTGNDRTVLEFILKEGRNRQIRKMCEKVGLKVARLKRIAIGRVKLGMLQPGEWRELTSEEVKMLVGSRVRR